MHTIKWLYIVILWVACVLPAVLSGPALAEEARIDPASTPWRIRLHEAAVVQGDMVLLGDIGQLYGNAPAGVWEQLSQRPLWPAPPEPGKALQINRNKLEQALRQSLGSVADLCVLPKGMALQRGGSVLREEDLRAMVVRELTPQLRMLDGDAELADYRLPAYAFLSHDGQKLVMEQPQLAPGRVSLRFAVKEVDGRDLRKFTGTMMLHLWKELPTPIKPLNRGDAFMPDNIAWVRTNLAHVRGDLWDGRGGPWQVQRALVPSQPVYRSDLAPLAAVRKGAVVTLIYAKGNVMLSAKAEVLSEAALGDTVAVRNLQSGKQVYAVVQDNNTVIVK